MKYRTRPTTTIPEIMNKATPHGILDRWNPSTLKASFEKYTKKNCLRLVISSFPIFIYNYKNKKLPNKAFSINNLKIKIPEWAVEMEATGTDEQGLHE